MAEGGGYKDTFPGGEEHDEKEELLDKDKQEDEDERRWQREQEEKRLREEEEDRKRRRVESGMEMKGTKRRAEFIPLPPQRDKTKTSTSKETKFMGETRDFDSILQNREELEKDVYEVFPNIVKTLLPHIRRDEYNQLIFNQGKSNSKDWTIAYDGRPSHDVGLAKFPKGIRRLLGKTNEEINQEAHRKQEEEEERQAKREQELEEVRRYKAENYEKLKDAEERVANLQQVVEEKKEARKNALTSEDEESNARSIETTREAIRQVSVEVEELRVERGRLEQVERNADEMVQDGERQVEAARERVNQRLLSLRDRIKEIFKKHGFTVVAVITAIGTVIGVIVSNLKAGLTKVAKGVGNGLKELGKKLGEILPGMIGAIASFIFKTAGEAIGFLAKNAWLLIVGLVVLAVEQFKKRSR